MKTKNYLSIISILFFSFLFVSCSKEDEGDTIKPVIDLLEPEEGAILRIGSSHGVHFEMNLHDNEAIASYKINIHNNFDGHSHTRASEAGITKPFTFERTYTDKAGQAARDFTATDDSMLDHFDIEQSEEFKTTKYFCKTHFDMKKIKDEEKHYVPLPKIYEFKNDKEKEILLNRNFKRVNQEVEDMVKELLGIS